MFYIQQGSGAQPSEARQICKYILRIWAELRSLLNKIVRKRCKSWSNVVKVGHKVGIKAKSRSNSKKLEFCGKVGNPTGWTPCNMLNSKLFKSLCIIQGGPETIWLLSLADWRKITITFFVIRFGTSHFYWMSVNILYLTRLKTKWNWWLLSTNFDVQHHYQDSN